MRVNVDPLTLYNYGKDKPILHTGSDLAYNPSVSQEEFLLKFAKDRRRWLKWLFESKKRFRTRILPESCMEIDENLLVM